MLRKFRRGRVWHVRGAVRGQVVYESTGTADAERAEAYRVKREAEIWDGRVLGRRATVKFADALIAYKTGREIGRQDTANFLRLLDWFGRWRLRDIDQAALDAFVAKHCPEAKPATVSRHAIAPLSAVLNVAARRSWCERPRFDRPKLPPGRVRWITHEEADRMIGHAAPHLKPLLIFLLNTGARMGEAIALDWRDVDLGARRTAFTATKNGTSRGVPLNDAAFAALANLGHREGRVFRTHTGEPYKITEWRSGNIMRGLSVACRKAGIENFHPHDCRHTFASWAVMAGVPLRTVAELLGHKTIAMTMRYSHLSASHLQEAVDAISRVEKNPALPEVRSKLRRRGATR